jgi:hypothetical protein
MPEMLQLSTGLIGARKNSSGEAQAGKMSLSLHEMAIGGVYIPLQESWWVNLHKLVIPAYAGIQIRGWV